MSTIPVNQDVNVTPSVLGAGGSAINLNGLVLTTNTRVPIGSVQSFSSALAVSNFFGASSAEAARAAVYFGGFDGSNVKPATYLFTQYPTGSVSAYVRGGNISALPLATLQGYSGTLNVTIDGVLKTASVNLSAATSFSNAAEIIAVALGIEGVLSGSVTGSIGGTGTTCTTLGTTLTMGALATGTFQVGDTLTASDGGGHSLSTQTILAQLTGTPGGSAGATFQMSAAGTGGDLTSTTVTAKGKTLEVSAGTAGTISAGDVLSGAGVTANTYVAAQILPLVGSETLGGIGRYTISVSPAAVVASETIQVFTPAVEYDSVSGAFLILSGTAGATSTITYGSGAMGTNLLLTLATGAVLSQGAVAATPAAFMNAVIAQTTNWATFATMFDPDAGSGFANKLLFSLWTNGQNNRYAYVPYDTDTSPTLSVPATASYGYALSQAGYSGTILDWQPSALNHTAFIQGWAASIDFTQTNGRATLAFKSQAGLTPAVTDGTIAINLGGNPQVVGDRGNGYNFYATEGSGNAGFTFMKRGFVSGPFLWADSYVNQIWLNNSLQVALMNYLTQVKSVPFNAAGYAAVEQALHDAIQAGLIFGAYVPGVTLSTSQIAAVNAAAGVDAATPLQQRGWYLQIVPSSPTVRAARGPVAGTFWYTDGQSIQSIALNSVAVQ